MTTDQPIDPINLVGAQTAADAYGVSRSTLNRRIAAGTVVPLTRLEGAYVFDRRQLPIDGESSRLRLDLGVK
jgi:hypothetical protein